MNTHKIITSPLLGGPLQPAEITGLEIIGDNSVYAHRVLTLSLCFSVVPV